MASLSTSMSTLSTSMSFSTTMSFAC
jgi:hypothetical protein